MFQGKDFVRRITCRVAIIWAVTLGFARCGLHAQTFTPPINVSGENSNAASPRIAVDAQGNINVVWLDNSVGTPAVFFSRSADKGQTFSTPLNISNHPGSPAESERVATDPAGNIYVVWSEDSSGAHTIFFSRSLDNGMSFSVPQSVSQNAMGTNPAMAIDSGGGVNLLWIDKSEGQRSVFFSRSTDHGSTFSKPLILSPTERGNGSPQLITDSAGNNYVVWTQANTGTTQSVFFSRAITTSAQNSTTRPSQREFASSNTTRTPAAPIPSAATFQLSSSTRSVPVPVPIMAPPAPKNEFAAQDLGGPIVSTRQTPSPQNSGTRQVSMPVLSSPELRNATASPKSTCNISQKHIGLITPNADACASLAETSQQSALLPNYSADHVQYFDCTHYSCFPDIGQGINKALSDVGHGGTVMISLGAITGTVSTTIIVGRNQSLICDPATVLQPGNTSVNIIAVGVGATVRGCSISTTNEGAYSGAVLSLTGNYRDNSHTSLSDISINAEGNPLCDAILMSASNLDESIAFVSLMNIRIDGCNNGVHLLAKGGWINGNQFQDIHVSFAVHAFNLENTSNAVGATISGNECLNCSSQKGPLSIDSIHVTGVKSGENVQNMFAPFTAWDYDTAISLDSSAAFNVFMGRWDGTISDPTGLNTYITGGQDAIRQPGAYISENATDSFVATTSSQTQQKDMHLGNAGGSLYVGVDNNVGSGFGLPYDSVWYSPNNNSYFVSPVSTFTGMVHQALTISDTGSACTKGELSLSTGWGESASVSSAIGTGQTCQWTITAEGTTSAKPTVTDILTDALPSPSTVCDMHMVGGTGSATLIQETTFSATTPVFTFNGTPSAGSTYVIVRRCGP